MEKWELYQGWEWGGSCPQAAGVGFLCFTPTKDTYLAAQGRRELKECLVLSPLNFCGRRRCSHRAFIKGGSFICLMAHGGLQHLPWCSCCSHNWHPNPQWDMLGQPHPSPPWTEHAKPCLGYLSLSREMWIVLKHSKHMETSHFGGFSGGKGTKTKIWELTLECSQAFSLGHRWQTSGITLVWRQKCIK